MAGIKESVQEYPEYLFDHSTNFDIFEYEIFTGGEELCCVAIDQFTNHIYVLVTDAYLGVGTILIYTQSGEFLKFFSHENIWDINGMAIHKNNVYIVSGLSYFLHYKVADFISLICRKNDIGSGIGEFMKPRQLDISSVGDLFVVDFGNNRVQILDGNLQYKRNISHHSMLKPCDVKLTPDEVYVLGDCPKLSNYCIHIFTYLGEKLRSVILNGTPNSMLCRGFCVDTFGSVIIIDYATQQIKFFTKVGNLFATMDTIGRISNMHMQLNGVAWMDEHKLVVLSRDYNQLDFSLEMYY